MRYRLYHHGGLAVGGLRLAQLSDQPRRYAPVQRPLYLWGTWGVGYNEKMVSNALSGASINSWALLFDPAYAAKLANCGIHVYDDGPGILKLALIYLKKDPVAPRPEDIAMAERTILAIRPFVRVIDNVSGIQALCSLSLGMPLTRRTRTDSSTI